MLHAKRWLYLVHRWMGVVLCAFFAMWFFSGVVMMYVGYPKLTAAERRAPLPPLHTATVGLEPEQALHAAGIEGPLSDLRLAVASGGRAVYLAMPLPSAHAGHKRMAATVIDASTGELLHGVDAARATASAQAFAAGAGVPRYLDRIDEDAFTHSRALDAHRPLYRLELGDSEGTVVYVSGTTGEVVRDATRTERGWNYAGAWIHWLYPFRGNAFDAWWADIVNWLSIAGIALTITGTVVGVMRWRFTRRYKTGSHSPYRGFMMRWHHVFGLLFAAVTLTWIFSGLMSMNPWKIFDSGAPPLRTQAMHGGPLVLPAQPASVQALLAAASPDTRELRWVRSAGHTLVQAASATGRPALLDAGTAQPHTMDPEALQAAAARLLPDPVARTETLRDYDLYYYSRAPHTMMGGSDKPLPVLRVVFADAHSTWVHIDPHTGAVLDKSDTHRRASRWLFALLHSWDWGPLLARRPLWDMVLIVLSLGGAVLSLTGVVVGWRRLAHQLRPSRKATAGSNQQAKLSSPLQLKPALPRARAPEASGSGPRPPVPRP